MDYLEKPSVLDKNSLDVITYAGEINNNGYEMLCDLLQRKKSENALLVLATPGGNPHAGFRIARALQCTYEQFDALVPRYCKSAGTLILTGAKSLYLDDRSELGPLDIQIKKGDELIGRNSGLDIFQAVNYLQTQTGIAFNHQLLNLTQEHGLSTKVASDIAVSLTSSLFAPIAAQIDPIKLAEMQRATEVAIAYGSKLNQKGGNLRDGAIVHLVSGYPAHGYVIDRKEARSLFINVEKPAGFLALLSEAMRASLAPKIGSSVPEVTISYYCEPKGVADEPVSATPANGHSEGAASSSVENHDGGEANRPSTKEESRPIAAKAKRAPRAANG